MSEGIKGNIFDRFKYDDFSGENPPFKKIKSSPDKSITYEKVGTNDPPSVTDLIDILRKFKFDTNLHTSVDDFQGFCNQLKLFQGENIVFCMICAGILGAQTRDSVAMKATKVLIELCNGVLSPSNLSKIELYRLEESIKFVNYYKTKAKNLNKLSQLLKDIEISSDYKSLLALPGVGPKIATLVIEVAVRPNTVGIVVDTHVHRLGNIKKILS